MASHSDPTGQSRVALGRTVRQLRIARRLTLRALAGQLGVSPATVSAIENGRTKLSAERIAWLAQLFGVPVQRMFVPGEGEQPAQNGPVTDRQSGTGALHWRSYPSLRLDTALGGALSSFLEFGYHGASMRIIAERANLSVAGLYHYYPSKQDMLVALLDLTMTDLKLRTLAARDEGSDPVERFVLLVECLALFHTHRRELGFVGASEMRSLEPESRRRVAGLRREQQRLVDHEVEQAVAAGAFRTARPGEAARAVVTMCTALPHWFHQGGPASAEQIAGQYVEFALALVQSVAART